MIFIYNHLDNHPYYTVDDDFQITLDSHFISSLILNKYYQDPGIRVSRYSLEGEKNHHAYYNRLGFIRVYAKDFTPTHLDPEELKNTNKQFYEKATNVLESKKKYGWPKQIMATTGKNSKDRVMKIKCVDLIIIRCRTYEIHDVILRTVFELLYINRWVLIFHYIDRIADRIGCRYLLVAHIKHVSTILSKLLSISVIVFILALCRD